MAISGSTWRAHPLQIGAEYEARESFPGLTGGEFIAGRRYALRHIGYSHYDGSAVFRFQGRDDAIVDWWWYDTEPDDLCAVRFQWVA